METEVWRDVVGYEGYYQVSNMGRLKSVDRIIIRTDNVSYKLSGKIRKLPICSDGYVAVVFHKNNVHKTVKLHRLIAELFVPNPDNKPQVNHKNSIRNDNRYYNLEWVTASENLQHGYDFGFKKPPQTWLGKKGALNKDSKPVLRIDPNGNVLDRYHSCKEASMANGINYTTMRRIVLNDMNTDFVYEANFVAK